MVEVALMAPWGARQGCPRSGGSVYVGRTVSVKCSLKCKFHKQKNPGLGRRRSGRECLHSIPTDILTVGSHVELCRFTIFRTTLNSFQHLIVYPD